MVVHGKFVLVSIGEYYSQKSGNEFAKIGLEQDGDLGDFLSSNLELKKFPKYKEYDCTFIYNMSGVFNQQLVDINSLLQPFKGFRIVLRSTR